MGCFVLLLLILVVSLCEVRSDKGCHEFNNTGCSQCVDKGHNCYWCHSSGQCIHWDWADYPNCKEYYYGQCDLSGVVIIILVSVVVFLLLFALVCCCICCCYCFIKYRKRRRRRRNYTLITETTERSNVPVNDTPQQERQAARSDEDTATRTNDSTV